MLDLNLCIFIYMYLYIASFENFSAFNMAVGILFLNVLYNATSHKYALFLRVDLD